jgi:transketolase
VALALAALEPLAVVGIAARVVSMPATTVFDREPVGWRNAVLPRGVPRVALEAGVSAFWRKYVGLEGEVLGVDSFGESAPAAELFGLFGLTARAVVDAALRVVRGSPAS